MSDGALVKKLKIKPGQRAALVNAPAGYVEELSPLPAGVELSQALDGQYDWLQLFVKNTGELGQLIGPAVKALGPQGTLWICFPKGSSKIQTDLTRDHGWESVGEANLKWITLISVNDTWSAFGLRPYKPGEPRQNFR